jgi:hypothetical protein
VEPTRPGGYLEALKKDTSRAKRPDSGLKEVWEKHDE